MSNVYKFSDGGGFVPTRRLTTLTPPAAFLHELTSFISDAGTMSCSPPLPACLTPGKVDVADVETAIGNADVQSALMRNPSPMYGNTGIADGPSFDLRLPNGRGFSAGIDCNVPSPTCFPTPAGITALMKVLRDLLTQQLADPACATLRP